jgi:hypothetical protein
MRFNYTQAEFDVLEDGWAVRKAFSYGEGTDMVTVYEARSPEGRIQRIGFGKGCELYADVTHPST